MKSRILEKIQEKAGFTEVITKDPDLTWAKDNYNALLENLYALVDCLKDQHKSLSSVRSTRVDVVTAVQDFVEDTPLWEIVGAVTLNEEGHSVNNGSYASVVLDMDRKSEMLIERFEEYVVQYAEEWRRVVKTRVSQSLKILESTRIEYDHYQRKVATMRNSIEVMNEKGKEPNSAFTVKLTRNVEKLDECRNNYEKARIDTYMLLNEVTVRSWKDLQPLVLKMAQFDHAEANDAALKSNNLKDVVSALKELAVGHRVCCDGRLKQLAEDEVNMCYSESDYINSSLPQSTEKNIFVPMSKGGSINSFKEIESCTDGSIDERDDVDRRDAKLRGKVVENKRATKQTGSNGAQDLFGSSRVHSRENQRTIGSLITSNETESLEGLHKLEAKGMQVRGKPFRETTYDKGFSSSRDGSLSRDRERKQLRDKLSARMSKNRLATNRTQTLTLDSFDKADSDTEKDFIPFRTISPVNYESEEDQLWIR